MRALLILIAFWLLSIPLKYWINNYRNYFPKSEEARQDTPQPRRESTRPRRSVRTEETAAKVDGGYITWEDEE